MPIRQKKIIFMVVLLMATIAETSERRDYPIRPIVFTQVRISDNFWQPRMENNRKVTIPYIFRKCEETGRIDNFAVAGRLNPGKFRGIYFNDSDVFKIVEAASYSLSLSPDAKLEKYFDELIFKIAAAQENDGYLYTCRTIDPNNLPAHTGQKRWSNLVTSHELYNVGHMYEAGVAHYQATGKRSLLEVCIRNAELIDSVFGQGKRYDPPGHQEIEIGLVKLYRVTGREKYIQLAKFFLDQRGRANNRKLYGARFQDHKPVTEQTKALGHAVRACYMYSAMADAAALTDDVDYLRAIDTIWENVVSKKLYITGSVGSRHHHEAFGEDYELPNMTAYNETCAAIANAMWNLRMFLLHGDAKYIDILERTIYNGFLSGISLSGDEFFYPNPLASDGKYKFNKKTHATRKGWFACSCCPANIVRFIPSLPGYVYALFNDRVYINLFVGGSGTIKMQNNTVVIRQETLYPWDGDVKLSIEPTKRAEFAICIRIPGWARNKPVPSNLYRYLNSNSEKPILKVNGKSLSLNTEKGFAVIRRKWQKGDIINITFPMPVRSVLCNEKVTNNVGRVAIERGPIVYCAEGIDNGGRALNIVLPDDIEFTVEHNKELLGGVTVIRGKANTKKQKPFMAIPYYAWSHRGVGEMQVWLKRRQELDVKNQGFK